MNDFMVHTASTCTALLLWMEVPEIRISATDSSVYVSSDKPLSVMKFLYPVLKPP
jgi:hypothetical protein